MKMLHIICSLFTIISLLFVLVDEGLMSGFFPCLECINPEGMNSVGSTIGGSFIAGYIFYLFTCTIPNSFRIKQTNKLILQHVNLLNTWVELCNDPINILKNIIKDENDEEVYCSRDEKYRLIQAQITRLDEEGQPQIFKSLKPIYRYFFYLTPDQQADIESIEKSMLFLWSNYLKSKQQLYVKEVKVLISNYDSIKTVADNLKRSIK